MFPFRTTEARTSKRGRPSPISLELIPTRPKRRRPGKACERLDLAVVTYRAKHRADVDPRAVR